MKGNLTPILLLFISIGLFFGFIDPSWSSARKIQSELGKKNEDLANIQVFLQKKEDLLTKERSVPIESTSRLQKMLPDSIDSVRLILDLYNIADQNQIKIKTIDVSQPDGKAASDGSALSYGSLPVRITLTASYDDFKIFLRDIERSLMLLDVTNVSLRPQKEGAYEYSISAKTYWLK